MERKIFKKNTNCKLSNLFLNNTDANKLIPLPPCLPIHINGKIISSPLKKYVDINSQEKYAKSFKF